MGKLKIIDKRNYTPIEEILMSFGWNEELGEFEIEPDEIRSNASDMVLLYSNEFYNIYRHLTGNTTIANRDFTWTNYFGTWDHSDYSSFSELLLAFGIEGNS